MRCKIILFMLCVISAAACGGTYPDKDFPKSKDGILDLSTRDFEKKGPVELAGEWEFYWKQHIEPGVLFPEMTGLMELPGAWNNFSVEGKKLPGFGYGTFRLTVLLSGKETGKPMAFKIRGIHTASTFYVNGKKAGSTGAPSPNPNKAISMPIPGIIPFTAGKSRLEIIVHASNFDLKEGGLVRSILLGTENHIREEQEKTVSFEMFLFGSILLMGMYHFGFFIFRKKDKAPLYFGIICLLIAFRILVTGEVYSSRLFNYNNWVHMFKVALCTSFMAVPLFAMFVNSFFPGLFRKSIIPVLLVLGALFSCIAIAAPTNISSHSLYVYQVIILGGSLYILYILILALIRKRKGAGIFLGGLLFLLLTVVNDILYDNLLIQTGFFVPLGLFVFITTQALLISLRFSTMFNRVEALSKKLEENNSYLEETVNTRTRELKKTNRSLMDSNKKLETAQKMAEIDMEMAIHVQTNFLPREVPSSEEWEAAYFFRPMAGVSGDFYDFYVINETFVGTGLFDVSGHGVSSGLITMLAKSIIFRNYKLGYNHKLNDVFMDINKELQAEIATVHYFLTGVLLRFNNDIVEYVNAGHPDIFMRSGEKVFPVTGENNKSISGAYLGLDYSDLPYEVLEFKVKKGDYILLYSDALIEEKNKNGEPYQGERVERSLEKAPAGSAREILCSIVKSFYDFNGSKDSLSDDLTVIVLKKL
ncbi:MAG: SpoIIE family protein phosphatase [bacterium]|nr:SpoIIE family protein phosphatase [bacterium]